LGRKEDKGKRIQRTLAVKGIHDCLKRGRGSLPWKKEEVPKGDQGIYVRTVEVKMTHSSWTCV